jgi:hypothetical protein
VRVQEGRDEEMARNAFQAGGFGLVAPWPIRCGLLEWVFSGMSGWLALAGLGALVSWCL